jgi:hypothetical protein
MTEPSYFWVGGYCSNIWATAFFICAVFLSGWSLNLSVPVLRQTSCVVRASYRSESTFTCCLNAGAGATSNATTIVQFRTAPPPGNESFLADEPTLNSATVRWNSAIVLIDKEKLTGRHRDVG